MFLRFCCVATFAMLRMLIYCLQIAMDNGPAFKSGIAHKLYAAGEEMADPFEISTIRREVYCFGESCQ